MMKKISVSLIVLHYFVGLGALFGGSAAVINPQSPMGMSVDALKNSPFSTFLIPGLFLLLVLGGGNLAGIAISRKFPVLKGYIAGFMGAVLIAWIVIQCILLQAVVFLHILFFIIGAVQGCLGGYLLLRPDKG